MRTGFFKLIIVMIFASVFSLPIIAEETDELSAVIKRKVAVVTGLMHNNSMEKEKKDAKIIESVEKLVDFPLMARLSLGKKAWLHKAKQKEYTDLFVKRVKNSYLEKLYLYTDEKIIVKEGVQTKKSRIEVSSYIIGKTDQKEILYKFYKTKKDGWLIYDLEIAGVSIVQTYRSQFAEILKTASVDELIGKLRASDPL